MFESPSDGELIPVRMLNEFVYCPRLFHLEYVQGEWAASDDTAEGESIHRRVDRPAGAFPRADDLEDQTIRARAVMLDAPHAGLVAKLDIIEGEDGWVVPVERKRGRPRADGTVWEPEEMQAVAQAVVLRENGYRVDRALLSYPAARERVEIMISDERVTRLERYVRDLRIVREGPCPPPLVDSPKCPRCSLVGICLPDETERLRNPPPLVTSVRALVPADDAQPLYVQLQGARVGLRQGRVEVRKDDELISSSRRIDVSHVSIYGNVSVSASALRSFCEHDIPVTHHSYGGWLCGVTTGPGHKNAQLRIHQFATAADKEQSILIARRMIEGKLRNARTMLRRNHRQEAETVCADLMRLVRQVRPCEASESLLGFEGVGARLYFGSFSGMLRESSRLVFSLAGRNRRPPRDPVNALLSFVYSLLVRETTVALIRVGLDPYVGIYHRPLYGRPALALDLAEEFRPLIGDSVVVGAINNGEIDADDFVERGGAFTLTSAGRRTMIGAFERRLTGSVRHPQFGYAASYRRVLELQARLLARSLTGEVPSYPPFVTR